MNFNAGKNILKILNYSLWKLLKSQKVAITHLAMGIDAQVTHHVVAMGKVAE